MPQLPLQWPTTPKGLPNGRVLPTVASRGLWGATGHQKRRQAAWNPGNQAPWRRRSRGETERRLVPFRREWELGLLLCCVSLGMPFLRYSKGKARGRVGAGHKNLRPLFHLPLRLVNAIARDEF